MNWHKLVRVEAQNYTRNKGKRHSEPSSEVPAHILNVRKEKGRSEPLPQLIPHLNIGQSERHSLQIEKDNVEKRIFVILRKEFPNYDYILTESENALTEMHLITKKLEHFLSKEISYNVEKYNSVKDQRPPTLLRELHNKRFGGEKVILEVIGEETDHSVFKNMKAEVPMTGCSTYSSINMELYRVYLCYPDNVGIEKALNNLRNLNLSDIQRVIFITKDQTRMEQILKENFPGSFPEPAGRSPIFSTEETLKTVISEVLLDRAFEVLDYLLSALKMLLVEANEECMDINCKQYKEKEGQLKNAIDDLESLTQERPGTNPPKLRCMDEDVRTNLMRLKDKGVKACCIYRDQMLVFVDTDIERSSELEQEVKSITKEYTENRIIVPAKCPLYKFQISDGDKIIPEREMKKDKKFGTIGTFVADERNRKIGLTAGHVVYKDEKIFTADDILLGICTEVSDQDQINAANLAVIEIDNQALPNCHERSTELCLFEGEKNEITNKQRVFKIGAKTRETRGIIVTDFSCFDHVGDYLVVEGLYGRPFAQGGDSGSVVYMRDLHRNKDVAISMVTAGDCKATASDAMETHDLHQDEDDVAMPSARYKTETAAAVEMRSDTDTFSSEEIKKTIENWTFTFMMKKEINEIEKRGFKLLFNS